MPKAEKLPSGSWRCRIYTHTDIVDGKKIKRYKTFTEKDPSTKGKKLCEKRAAEFAIEKGIAEKYPSVSEGIKKYINSKRNILSPSTIREYQSMANSGYDTINKIALEKLTQIKLQEWANDRAENVSPKTLRNNVGLLTAVFDMYGLKFPKIALPKKEPVKYVLPTMNDIKKMLEYCAENDKDLEVAIMFGAFCGMRRGEICALTDRSLSGTRLTIDRNIVRGEEEFIEKSPKTYNSTRIIEIPEFVAKRVSKIQGRFVNLDPGQVTNRFCKLRTRLGLPKFRFHDLRHFAASSWATMMPLTYVEKYGGWRPGSSVLKSVYINAMDEATAHYSKIANEYFETAIKKQP